MQDLTTKNDGIARSKERISITGTDSYKAELIKAFGNIDGNLAVNYSNWEEIIV